MHAVRLCFGHTNSKPITKKFETQFNGGAVLNTKGGGISKTVLAPNEPVWQRFEFPLIPVHLYSSQKKPAAGGLKIYIYSKFVMKSCFKMKKKRIKYC